MIRKMVFVFTVILYVCGATLTQAKEGQLLAGFFRVNITPEVPVTLAGYSHRKDLSTGIHDSLYARVSVFQNSDHRIVLVSVDILDFYYHTSELFRNTLLEQFDLKPEELFLAAIHTHSAPAVTLKEDAHPNNIAYTKAFKAKLAEAVSQALSDLQPVKMGHGKGSSPVGVNRRQMQYDEAGNPQIVLGRNPYGVHDLQVSVLKITDTHDILKSVVWEYATHSTSLGPKNYLVSGDVHGLAEQFIESNLGNDVIAPGFAGASGDIDPWFRILPGFETGNGWIPEPVLLATMLGEEVVHVQRNIEQTSPLCEINSIFETVELPGKTVNETTATQDHEPAMMNITVARVGDVAFVGLGAEVLSDIGLAIKAASPFEHTIVITHCNGTQHYISPQKLYIEGGYEVRNSPFASPAADQLVKHVVKLLHQL